jgi:hypothetical protein
MHLSPILEESLDHAKSMKIIKKSCTEATVA